MTMALRATSAAAAVAAAEPLTSNMTTKTKKKHFIGQKVKLFVAGEPVLNVLMWGINHTVSDLANQPVPVMLLPDDFKAYSKIKVDNHLYSREHLPSHFKFKEYCPVVFRNIRERFGLDDQDYLGSLVREAPLRSEEAQGRFGHAIFLSSDRRLLVKTVSAEDVAEIHNILVRYHAFVVECHGQTLLPQFLGLYKLTVEGTDTFAVVTRNVFGSGGDGRLTVHRKYDLKGSTVSREAGPKERAKELPTLKDNDFLRDGQRLLTGDEGKKSLLEKLRRDVEFLAALKMMDYSLLVGIHNVTKAEREEREAAGVGRDRTEGGGGAGGEFDPSVDVYAVRSHERAVNKEVYFMAIVGILTHYDAKKKAAHAAKTVKHGGRADISTVNPEQYSKRFLEFITTILS